MDSPWRRGKPCYGRGRYSCAQALLQRQLDFLKGFSLGEARAPAVSAERIRAIGNSFL